MKKKINDLTIKEIREICSNNECKYCPLREKERNYCIIEYYCFPSYSEDFEKVIEVEDEK